MKKRIVLLLIFAVLISLSGCGNSEETFLAPVKFYYSVTDDCPDKSSGIIRAETKEGAMFKHDAKKLFETYLKGPDLPYLQSPIPEGIHAESIIQNGNRVFIYMSSNFAKLTGVELTVACSCIGMTLMDATDAVEVSIYVKGAMLDGQKFILITRNNVILNDTDPMTENKKLFSKG